MGRAMGLPASQERVLDRIEEMLQKREPRRRASMFAMFHPAEYQRATATDRNAGGSAVVVTAPLRRAAAIVARGAAPLAGDRPQRVCWP
jgi:hypothetical protein